LWLLCDFLPVFRIRIWIRSRRNRMFLGIPDLQSGSVPKCHGSPTLFTYWSGSESSFFVSGWQGANKKYFFSTFFCLLLVEGTFTSFFIDEKSKRSHKNSRNQGFSNFVLLLMGGSVSVQNNDGSGSGRPKTY